MKNKLLKILAPTLLGATTLIPVCAMTSCGNKDNGYSVQSNNSYGVYEFKLDNATAGQTVNVEITNASADQEQMTLYTADGTTGSTKTYTVEADGKTLKVGAGYALAPSRSASSNFSLKISYGTSNDTMVVNVNNLHFNYVIDYGAELKDGNYPKTPAKDASHWTQGFKKQYKTDILVDNNIFQNDARYTTADRISKSTEFKNLESFKAFFNDIMEDNGGLYLHMNYQIKGTKDNSSFEFVQTDSKVTYKFTNFDFTFSYETRNGYELQLAAPQSNDDYKKFYIVDSAETSKYVLDGRFEGKFTCSKKNDGEEWSEPTTINYNGVIGGDQTANDETPKWWADMITAGVIHQTYGFSWGTNPPVLSIYSTYAANATND